MCTKPLPCGPNVLVVLGAEWLTEAFKDLLFWWYSKRAAPKPLFPVQVVGNKISIHIYSM